MAATTAAPARSTETTCLARKPLAVFPSPHRTLGAYRPALACRYDQSSRDPRPGGLTAESARSVPRLASLGAAVEQCEQPALGGGRDRMGGLAFAACEECCSCYESHMNDTRPSRAPQPVPDVLCATVSACREDREAIPDAYPERRSPSQGRAESRDVNPRLLRAFAKLRHARCTSVPACSGRRRCSSSLRTGCPSDRPRTAPCALSKPGRREHLSCSGRSATAPQPWSGPRWARHRIVQPEV